MLIKKYIKVQFFALSRFNLGIKRLCTEKRERERERERVREREREREWGERESLWYRLTQ